MHYRVASPVEDSWLLGEMNLRLVRDEGHRNPMTVDELVERMRSWLTGEYEAVIFERDGKPVGNALYRAEDQFTYLRQFYVAARHRRQGFGRQAFMWLREHPWRDSPRIRLDVLVSNASGIEFWKSLKFHEYCLTMERCG